MAKGEVAVKPGGRCPNCNKWPVADYGRMTFTNTLGTFCGYKCLTEYEAKLFEKCGHCDGSGKVLREVPDLKEVT